MLPPLCPNREEHAHMTLRRHASPRAPSKRGKGQRSTTAVPFLFTPPAPSVQGRARAHDIAPFHFTPPAPAKWGRAAFNACRAVRLYHACAIHAGKGVFTWHCAVSPRPAHSVRARKGWKRCQQIRGCSRAHCPSRKEHAQSPRLLRGLCENSIQLFSRGSLASSGKDHFHNWKEQSCLSVRMDTSPSENLNFSAQLSIQERTRQAMCSVPASKWYNGIAS